MTIRELIDELQLLADEMGSDSYEVQINRQPIALVDSSYACICTTSDCTPSTTVQIYPQPEEDLTESHSTPSPDSFDDDLPPDTESISDDELNPFI